MLLVESKMSPLFRCELECRVIPRRVTRELEDTLNRCMLVGSILLQEAREREQDH